MKAIASRLDPNMSTKSLNTLSQVIGSSYLSARGDARTDGHRPSV